MCSEHYNICECSIVGMWQWFDTLPTLYLKEHFSQTVTSHTTFITHLILKDELIEVWLSTKETIRLVTSKTSDNSNNRKANSLGCSWNN